MTPEPSDKLNLIVSICQCSGFCSGVIRAVRLAEDALDRGEEVYCVGKIVHNGEEINRLIAKGLHIITLSELPGLKDKTILFRAHGEPPSSYKLARQNGNRLIDASCRVVLTIQDKVRKALANNEHVVIYGKMEHPEVLGLMGQGSEQIIVLESIEDADKMALPSEITLFSQTTQSLYGYHELVKYLEKKGIKIKLHDTVCRQVHNREAMLEDFAAHQDVIIFVAGRDSSNGKVLYNICRNVNPNSHFISTIKELDFHWFSPHQHVGIAGATSTPYWLLDKVKDIIEDI